MNLKFFDVQASILGATVGRKDVVSADEMLEDMAPLGITQILTRIAPDEREVDVEVSNSKIYDEGSRHRQIVPCPVVVPNTAGDLADEKEQVAEAITRGAAAMRIRPAADAWFVADWISDPLFHALSERKMPLYLSAGVADESLAAAIAGRFPELPILYAEVGYRSHRTLLPMLERFPSIRLSIGNNYAIHEGIEQIVERTGADRLVFGTAFPGSEPAAAVTQLLYANISEEEKQLVASGNMERLVEEIRQ